MAQDEIAFGHEERVVRMGPFCLPIEFPQCVQGTAGRSHDAVDLLFLGADVHVPLDDIDDIAIRENRISITPIHYDLTNYAFLEELRSHWPENF